MHPCAVLCKFHSTLDKQHNENSLFPLDNSLRTHLMNDEQCSAILTH